MSDQLEAKNHDSQTKLVENLRSDSSVLATLLASVEENRNVRIEILANNVFAKGFEELFQKLTKAKSLFDRQSQLSKISFIIERIKSDFEVAVDAFLSGSHSVVLDLMRGVMEAEYLMGDFAAEPARIQDWLEATEQKRWNKYGPGALRKRLATRKGTTLQEMMETYEYKIHSRNLHLSPKQIWFAPRGFHRDKNSFAIFFCLGEIFEHALRFIHAIYELISAYENERSQLGSFEDFSENLTKFFRALEMTKFQIEVFKQLLGETEEEIVPETLPEGASLNLFEIFRKSEAKRVAEEIRKKQGKNTSIE